LSKHSPPKRGLFLLINTDSFEIFISKEINMSKEKLKPKFLKILEKNRGLIYMSAKECGINKNTYYNWRKTDAEFAEAADFILEIQLDKGESKLFDELEKDSPNPQLLMFYLRTKGKHRGYADTNSIDADISNVIPEININVNPPKNQE
jgi:hypothetical protein